MHILLLLFQSSVTRKVCFPTSFDNIHPSFFLLVLHPHVAGYIMLYKPILTSLRNIQRESGSATSTPVLHGISFWKRVPRSIVSGLVAGQRRRLGGVGKLPAANHRKGGLQKAISETLPERFGRKLQTKSMDQAQVSHCQRKKALSAMKILKEADLSSLHCGISITGEKNGMTGNDRFKTHCNTTCTEEY